MTRAAAPAGKRKVSAYRRRRDRRRDTAAALLASPLYARAREGRDVFGLLLDMWDEGAGGDVQDMASGIVRHACRTRDLAQLTWALGRIAVSGTVAGHGIPVELLENGKQQPKKG